MRKILFILGVLVLWLPASALEITRLQLTQCEKDALAASPELKQYGALADAAESSYKATRTALYPTLTLDAKGSWDSEVPSLQISAGNMDFGDNWGYSAGPTLNYVLFDNGARSGQSKSARASADAKAQEAAFARKQILLQTRQAYFAVQAGLEQLNLLYGQLAVARKQFADIESSFKAGAKSKLDVFIARKQMLRAESNIAAARGRLGADLRTLFKLTGTDYGINPAYPLDARLTKARLDGEVTALIQTDSLADSLRVMDGYKNNSFDENSPRLAALESMSRYYEYLADSYQAGLYPRLSVHGGAYFEYPNGPIREHIFLGRAGAAFSMPLFENGKTRRQSEAKQHEARAAQYQREDVQNTLEKMFYSSKDELYALSLQEQTTRRMIEDAAQSAGLTYEAYQAGAATFFDVDNANLGLLESQISLAEIQTRQLYHLAVLNSLGKENL